MKVLSISLLQDAPLAARQMAGVLLKQFVENAWSECPHTATKDLVKANILPGLADSISKIRYEGLILILYLVWFELPLLTHKP